MDYLYEKRKGGRITWLEIVKRKPEYSEKVCRAVGES